MNLFHTMERERLGTSHSENTAPQRIEFPQADAHLDGICKASAIQMRCLDSLYSVRDQSISQAQEA